MNKRGQGIQFNWIFVMISGALFLIFFAFFGVKYVELEQSKESAKVVRALDSAISGSKSLSQYKIFGEELPDFNIYYDCENLFVNDDQWIELNNIIFVEERLKNPISLWSKEYKKPYLIDNVVFMWDPDLRFYFDSEINTDFIEGLPDEIKITNNENNADVLVYFGSANSNLNKKVIAFNGNLISFVNENKNFEYNGDNIFVYGAMFSDYTVFECSKKYLDERRETMKEIYIKKTELFGNKCIEYNKISEALRKDDSEDLEILNEALYNHNCEVIF